MPSILSVAMRPRTLSGLYGQAATVAAIRNHMAKRPPRAWLFYGEPGCGKTTLARAIAVSLQCDHMKVWGDPCEACWRVRDSFPIHEINVAEHSGVDELEKIAEISFHRPMTGAKRVIILDEIHYASKSGFSAILKPLEEAPEFTVWILCTSEFRKVPVANVRRCVKYQLKTLGISGVEGFLKRQAAIAKVERGLEPLIEACHVMGIGSPGILLQALEKYAAGASATDATASADATVDSFRLCKAVTSGEWKTVCTILKDATPEDSRYLRASVAGWIKGCLTHAQTRLEQEKAAKSLMELCSPPYDETQVLNWLYAVLFQITARYGNEKR